MSKQEHYEQFDDMGLKESLLRGIFSYGFEKPSTIQSRAIVPITEGIDIIAQSQSGTGKTGTFVIGSLQRIDEDLEGCQIIIISHTRELAYQTHTVCTNVSQYLKNIVPVVCVGGSNIHEARSQLRTGANIVIGTPGRLIDMIERGFLKTDKMKLLVLDEADELLSAGFEDQIRIIVENIPKSSQICMFSATMPGPVIELSEKFMNDPKKILIKHEEITLEGIKQFYVNVQDDKYKLEIFCDLYDTISVSQSIVYVNRKQRADWLKDMLEENKFTVSVMHSDMSSEERQDIMEQFRSGKTRILITTDLLARGIDIQQVSVVINYDIPNDKECYIHRIGRSGRFGRKGVAINFATSRDIWKIEELERFYLTQIADMPENIGDYIGQ
jgi:translation initiation factor 4A